MAAQDAFVRVDMAGAVGADLRRHGGLRQAAVAPARRVAVESEVDETLRGMPYNVTTEMDLALWRLAADAGSSASS